MSSASLRSAQSSASPKRTSSSDSGSTTTPDAPDACRITVSLVESCPSTETRSNERATQTPSSRSAVSSASAASVWTKQSIVANAGEIIPAPLACAVSRTVPEGSATSTSTSLGNLSVVRIASEKSPCPYSRSSARALAIPRIASPASSGTPITPVEATATWSSGTPPAIAGRALHARRVLEATVAGRRVGVAGVGHDHAQRVQPRALLGQHDRRRQHARAREPRRATRSRATSRPSARGPSRRTA